MQDRRISCGDQSYPAGDPSTAPVGAFTQKLSARLQASGEAQFSSDLHPNTLVYGQFVVVADNGGGKARIENIDATSALKMPGVIDFVAACDIPGLNL